MEEELPVSWLTTTIGTVTLPIEKIDPSKTPSKEIAYLDISGIDNKSNTVVEVKHYLGKDAPSRARQRVKKDDILFSTVRTYLKNIAVVPAQYDGQIASTGFSILRVADSLSSQFLFYYSLTSNFLNRLADLQRGSSYPAVRDDDVRIQKIPLPPVNEQKRIVDKIERLFSNLDEGEALLKQVQKQLATYRQSVLKAAVTGELTKEWREANKDRLEPGEALLQRILKSRRENWNGRGKYQEPVAQDTSNLSKLPKGWVWVNLDAVTAEIITGPFGSSLHKSDYVPNGIPLINPINIQKGKICPDNTVTVSPETLAGMERFRVRTGDVIFGRRGEMGRCAPVTHVENGWLCGTGSLILRPTELINVEYLVTVLTGLEVRAYLEANCVGSTMKNLNQQVLLSIVVAVPSVSEQSESVDRVNEIFSQIDTLETWCATELTRSATLRQSILKDAFSGKLVPQDPTDEPANELLKRIQAQKEAIKKPKTAKRKTKATA